MLPGKTDSGWTKTQPDTRYPRRGFAGPDAESHWGQFPDASDTRVMPPKILPDLPRCRSLARLGRPDQVRASRTSSYPHTLEKALKSTHTILRRAFEISSGTNLDLGMT